MRPNGQCVCYLKLVFVVEDDGDDDNEDEVEDGDEMTKLPKKGKKEVLVVSI